MVTLYRKHVGGIGTWRVWAEEDVLYIAHAVVEGGQEVVHTETVTTNQSGRSLVEQVSSRLNSRINRQLDRGYSQTRDEALVGNVNQLGLPLPMLAQPIKKVKNQNNEGAVLQLKLNGHRCLATRQDGKVILYSRRGKEITLPHIAETLDPILSEGTFLDGELYHHGTSLQTIGSWIKKLQPESTNLNYICYDLISRETFEGRYQELSSLLSALPAGAPVKVLPCIRYIDDSDMWRAFSTARDRGYEGLIKRLNDSPYQDGVRSSSLLKVKAFEDCEVTVQDVVLSAKGVPVCECLTDEGKRVDLVPPGTQEEKRQVYDRRDQFVGRRLTIEYAELTKDGVPFHPVAREWREEL